MPRHPAKVDIEAIVIASGPVSSRQLNDIGEPLIKARVIAAFSLDVGDIIVCQIVP